MGLLYAHVILAMSFNLIIEAVKVQFSLLVSHHACNHCKLTLQILMSARLIMADVHTHVLTLLDPISALVRMVMS